jgi:mannose-6-phosphate isomerase-like protein (cupin superfamily)
MNSAGQVFGSLVLLFAPLPATTGTQVDIGVDGTKPVIGAVPAKGRGVKVAYSLAEGAPPDSSSCSCRVAYFNSEKVAAALSPDSQQMTGDVVNSKRGVLLDWDDVQNKYLLRVTRQDKNRALGERHSFTHIWYILDGSATLVTGGSLADPKTTIEPFAPWGGTLIRGPGIKGGETRRISKGDAVIVQRDWPHWWKEISDPPFTYLVVNIPPNSLEAGTQTPSSLSPITYFDSERMEAGFAKGSVLFDGKSVRNKYRVYTIRLKGPSPPEIHSLDTIIMYVLDGSAEYVTGGLLVDPKTSEPEEIRGTGIEGGVIRHLAKGNVIVVPNGVPQWFKSVRGPFLFYLVKVR